MMRVAALAFALVLSVGLGLATAQGAMADATPPPPPPASGGNNTPPPQQQAQDIQWHNCHIVSGPEYIGGVCAGASSEGKTPKEILGKQPVPGCWDDPVSEDDLAAMDKSNVPGPDGYTYYWHSCLTGIDPKTKEVEPGGMHIETNLKAIPNGTPPETLTKKQRELVDGVADRGNIPVPVAVVSPSDHPRVGLNVAFLNGSKGDLDVNPLGAFIHAYVDHTSIQPLGKDTSPTIGCPGNGTPAKPGQTPVSGDGLCWYKYLHSSAGQVDDVYHVQITSHWVVEISATGLPGTFERLDDFDKSAISQVPVTEIQALVVQ
jgi:hypothetical protein